jgi:hypothetical protein
MVNLLLLAILVNGTAMDNWNWLMLQLGTGRHQHLLPYSRASPVIPLLLLGCHSKLSNVYITIIYYRTPITIIPA